MSARVSWALIALLLVGSAVECLAARHEVGVFVRSDGGANGTVLTAAKDELARLLSQAGFSLRWWAGATAAEPVEAEELIVVDLVGVCRSPVARGDRRVPVADAGAELARTRVSGGQILPFSSLDCARVNSLIATPLARVNPGERDRVYGRALARVLAHEFYHVLSRTAKHTARGVAKRAHSADDLLGETFEYDSSALAQLRQSGTALPVLPGEAELPSEPATVTAASPDDGRTGGGGSR